MYARSRNLPPSPAVSRRLPPSPAFCNPSKLTPQPPSKDLAQEWVVFHALRIIEPFHTGQGTGQSAISADTEGDGTGSMIDYVSNNIVPRAMVVDQMMLKAFLQKYRFLETGRVL